ADEKCSLMTGMPPDGCVIFNADDHRLVERVSRSGLASLSFGFSPDANLRISIFQSKGVNGFDATFVQRSEHLSFHSKLCGAGNLYNIAAAAATSRATGLGWDEILRGIQSLEPYSQRGVVGSIDGIDIYDDTYNSNPAALKLAIDLIAESEGHQRK